MPFVTFDLMPIPVELGTFRRVHLQNGVTKSASGTSLVDNDVSAERYEFQTTLLTPEEHNAISDMIDSPTGISSVQVQGDVMDSQLLPGRSMEARIVSLKFVTTYWRTLTISMECL